MMGSEFHCESFFWGASGKRQEKELRSIREWVVELERHWRGQRRLFYGKTVSRKTSDGLLRTDSIRISVSGCVSVFRQASSRQSVASPWCSSRDEPEGLNVTFVPSFLLCGVAPQSLSCPRTFLPAPCIMLRDFAKIPGGYLKAPARPQGLQRWTSISAAIGDFLPKWNQKSS